MSTTTPSQSGAQTPEANQPILREISLKELFEVFKKRIIIILMAAFIASGGTYFYTKATYIPAYSSTATLYLSRQNQININSSQLSASYLASELSLSSILVNDCTYIMKMSSTMQEVINELNLNTTIGALRSSISTNNPQNTRVLEVSVVAASPELAKEIVDSVCRIGAEKITATIGIDQLNISEYGTLNYYPCNMPQSRQYIIPGFIAAVAVYAIFFLIFLFDDGIKTDSDVEQNLGLTVLGWIPDVNANHSKHYGYYRTDAPREQTETVKEINVEEENED